MKILFIDNFDSFTYNVVQLAQSASIAQKCTPNIIIKRNNGITLDEIRSGCFDRIVISPGPGGIESGGVSLDIFQDKTLKMPILGVCLGHQLLCHTEGASVIEAPVPVHGICSLITHSAKGIFSDVKNPLKAMRYHSLIVAKATLPASLECIAVTDDGLIMAVRHKTLPRIGVQFHPESFLSEDGLKIFSNFLSGYD